MSDKLTFSVISDIHVTHFHDGEPYFERTMRYHKERLPQFDMCILLGDVIYQLDSPDKAKCDNLYENHYDYINQALERYLPETKRVFVLGNHEFAQGNFDPEMDKAALALWERKFGQPPVEHFVQNGYHFVKGPVLSWANEYSEETEKELYVMLEEALADGNKPVFFISHCPAPDTVVFSYGTNHFTKEFRAFLAKNPRIIHISGHLHTHILDERAIYQDGFTSVSAPTNAVGAATVDVPDHDSAHISEMSQSLWFEVEGRKVTVHRVDIVGERETDEPWVIDIDETERGVYRFDASRKDRYELPEFAEDAEITVKRQGRKTTFVVKQFLTSKVMVQYYYLALTDAVGSPVLSKRFSSDFYNITLGNGMAEEITLDVTDIVSGRYTVEIYAMNSLLGQSERPLRKEFTV